jgi:hypothetical protein
MISAWLQFKDFCGDSQPPRSRREPVFRHGSAIKSVIPGRALRASPESITLVFAFNTHTPAQGVWIPGLRQVAHPRNDETRQVSSLPAKSFA